MKNNKKETKIYHFAFHLTSTMQSVISSGFIHCYEFPTENELKEFIFEQFKNIPKYKKINNIIILSINHIIESDYNRFKSEDFTEY